MSLAQQMHPQRRRRSKVHSRRSRRNLVAGKQRPAVQFEVRFKTPASREVPLQSQRIHPSPISRVVALKDHEDWHRIDCIFKSSIQKSGPMRPREDPTITQASIPNISTRRASGNRGSAAGPYLKFVATIFGPSLPPSR